MGCVRREDLGKHFLKHILFHPLPFSFLHLPLLIQPEKENWNLKTQKSSCNHNDEGQKGDHKLTNPCLFFSLLSLLIKCTEIKSWGSGEITGVTIDKLSFVWCHIASLLFLLPWIPILFFTQPASHLGCYDPNIIREKMEQKYEAISYHYRIFQFYIIHRHSIQWAG